MTYYISKKGLELEAANMGKAIAKLEAKTKENRAKIVTDTDNKLKELKRRGVALA